MSYASTPAEAAALRRRGAAIVRAVTDHYVGDFVRLEGSNGAWTVTVYTVTGEPTVIFTGTISEATERVAAIRLALATFDGFDTERHDNPEPVR